MDKTERYMFGDENIWGGHVKFEIPVRLSCEDVKYALFLGN